MVTVPVLMRIAVQEGNSRRQVSCNRTCWGTGDLEFCSSGSGIKGAEMDRLSTRRENGRFAIHYSYTQEEWESHRRSGSTFRKAVERDAVRVV